MLAVLQYSFNAVMPIILLILLGVFARRKGFLEPPMLRKVNKFNFRFNFFAMMFMNLYEVESIRQMPVRMGVFMIASHCLLVLLGIILSGFLTGERFRRGVLVQAVPLQLRNYRYSGDGCSCGRYWRTDSIVSSATRSTFL